MYAFIEICRAIAVCLITNSHFDGVYPINISWGGAPGNVLFFLISGFVLVNGVESRGFLRWFSEKAIRLYIPLFIISVLEIVVGYRTDRFISLFLFPIDRNHWFIPAILMLYIPYYIILKNNIDIKKVIVGLLILYIGCYIFYFDPTEFWVEIILAFRLIYGMIAMLLGAYIRKSLNKFESIIRYRKRLIATAILGCGMFLGVKLLIMYNVEIAIVCQFLTHVASFLFAIACLLAGVGYEETLRGFLSSNKGKIVGLISMCSLDIYLVQHSIVHYMKHMVFPINFMLIILSILLTAYVLHVISDIIVTRMKKYLFKQEQRK